MFKIRHVSCLKISERRRRREKTTTNEERARHHPKKPEIVYLCIVSKKTRAQHLAGEHGSRCTKGEGAVCSSLCVLPLQGTSEKRGRSKEHRHPKKRGNHTTQRNGGLMLIIGFLSA